MTASRYDVFTDAGRERGDMWQICSNVSSSNAHALERILRSAGWRVVKVKRDPATVMGDRGQDGPGE